MAVQSKRRNNKNLNKESNNKSKDQMIAVVLFAFSILLACLVFIKGENIWTFFHNFILGLFGWSAIIWPILLLFVAINTAKEKPVSGIMSKVWLSVTCIILFCSVVYAFQIGDAKSDLNYLQELGLLYNQGVALEGTGLFGGLLGIPFIKLFGDSGAQVFILVALFVCLMILTGTTLIQLFRTMKKPVNTVKDVRQHKKEEKAERIKKNRIKNSRIDIPLENESLPLHPVISEKPELPKKKKKKEPKKDNSVIEAANAFSEKIKDKKEEIPEMNIDQFINSSDNYNYPPVSLLDMPSKAKENDVTKELQNSGQILVDTLKSFGVQTKIVDISRGPTVTRYELQPAAGVKISKITNLADDIALNLAASGVRIEAPIPGKAAVGVEIPNKINSVVRMRELIGSAEFVKAKGKLTVTVGKDIAGNIQLADLAKMPHLLIAGSTGSGKSVCINSFIISLLYKSSPEEVRLLMIDPKVVELGIYNGIPHLLVPVVTDPRKAAGALNWAVNEMLNRYKIFADYNVRDLKSYNKMVSSIQSEDNKKIPEEEILKLMPQIVVIIDELADLMMAAPNEVEDSICRLAQMARAAGMHIVIATQRPSVDVITGVIKANIPSRIALAVSSQVDSRTILDMGGAEKLLGRGDMLFSPIGAHKPTRVQGCYVTDKEIESVINFVKNFDNPDYDSNIIEEIEKNTIPENNKNNHSNKEDDNQDKDPMLNEAIKCVVEAEQASTSMLQRRLRLGYARAGRLIDEMEQMGIVGPHEGSKPRKVLITYQQFLEMNLQKAD